MAPTEAIEARVRQGQPSELPPAVRGVESEALVFAIVPLECFEALRGHPRAARAELQQPAMEWALVVLWCEVGCLCCCGVRLGVGGVGGVGGVRLGVGPGDTL